MGSSCKTAGRKTTTWKRWEGRAVSRGEQNVRIDMHLFYVRVYIHGIRLPRVVQVHLHLKWSFPRPSNSWRFCPCLISERSDVLN